MFPPWYAVTNSTSAEEPSNRAATDRRFAPLPRGIPGAVRLEQDGQCLLAGRGEPVRGGGVPTFGSRRHRAGTRQLPAGRPSRVARGAARITVAVMSMITVPPCTATAVPFSSRVRPRAESGSPSRIRSPSRALAEGSKQRSRRSAAAHYSRASQGSFAISPRSRRWQTSLSVSIAVRSSMPRRSVVMPQFVL